MDMTVIRRLGEKLYLLDENGQPTTTSFDTFYEAVQWRDENGRWGVVDNKDGRKRRPESKQQILERAKRRKPKTFSERYWKFSPNRHYHRQQLRQKRMNVDKRKQIGL